MTVTTNFKTRIDEAVRTAGLNSREALAARLGAGDNPKQTAGQWVARAAIPLKYAKPLAELGISIDYLNAGTGPLRLAPASSQSTGLEIDMIRDAVKVARLVRDNSLEPVSDDVFVEVLALALQQMSAHSGSVDLLEMAREVAAAFRSRGGEHGNQR